jgi:hypothetical protein
MIGNRGSEVVELSLCELFGIEFCSIIWHRPTVLETSKTSACRNEPMSRAPQAYVGWLSVQWAEIREPLKS